jgi:RES domain-containing protein
MVYVASSASLAILEYRAHVPATVHSKVKLVLLKIALPSDPEPLDDADLPPAWNAIPPRSRTRDFGTEWAREARSLALAVPSVLLPTRDEFNVIVNPMHRDAARVRVINQLPFGLDERLL